VAIRAVSPAEAVAVVPDGASVALARPAALALAQELVRLGRRALHLVGVPTGGRAVELLIAAGCARSIETSGVDLGEDGLAPALSRAVEAGSLLVLDST
jgi:glutaconate CoA-transferase, subunit A